MTPQILDYTEQLAPEFARINTEWIKAMYVLEPHDREVLANPGKHIIAPGGAILFASLPGLGVVGTVALMPSGEGAFELTKMGVLEAARGRKVGEALLIAATARAQAMQVQLLYLLTNRKSAAAIHLYEKLGWLHDADIMTRYGATYERCNVAMRYPLQG